MRGNLNENFWQLFLELKLKVKEFFRKYGGKLIYTENLGSFLKILGKL